MPGATISIRAMCRSPAKAGKWSSASADRRSTGATCATMAKAGGMGGAEGGGHGIHSAPRRRAPSGNRRITAHGHRRSRLYARAAARAERKNALRSEEHTSELQSLMRISYAVFCLKKKNKKHNTNINLNTINDITQNT